VPRAEETAAADAARTARPLTGGDFASGLDGWQVEGGARGFRTFGGGKETGLTTFGKNRDADTGRLYQCFKVPADAAGLRFSQSGGASARTRVALWHRDRLCRWMTGRNDNTPFEVKWDVTALRGEVVTLEIVDESTAAWGFLAVGGFALVGRE
jgi:hypothetical protein